MDRYIIREIQTDEEKNIVAAELWELLREEDKREIAAYTNDGRKEVIDSLYMSDECWAAFTKQKRELIVAWGIRRVQGRSGRLIWCLGTYRMRDYWFPFSGQSRKLLWKWRRRYKVLYNAVALFNTQAIRWLEWCGATFQEPIDVAGEIFLPFEIREE